MPEPEQPEQPEHAHHAHHAEHAAAPAPGTGRLVLAATPIGDPQDASLRLVRLLAGADVIAAEDTRRLRRLAEALGVTIAGRVLSHHEHNEAQRADALVQGALAGQTVLLVTDAGMPGVSDPGLRTVRAALQAGVPVQTLPGPSAALTALAMSGLAVDRFCFEGFLPRTGARRLAALRELATERRTMIFFESPRRCADTLADMVTAFGPQRAGALCRELTKTHEQVLRQDLQALARHAVEVPVLGEVTLVVAGAPLPVGAADDPQVLAAVARLVADGTRMKDAVHEVAAEYGVAKRALYDEVVRTSRSPT